ncbi:MAG: thioredoxin fold domain-containing protein [Ignavibacteriaceae bacterium]|nr:thioredoxin fold domain-containing protein [Ignavibacteriaceae bacterium]
MNRNILFLFLLLLAVSVTYSQPMPPEDIVTIKSSLSFDRAPAGTEVKLAVKARIKEVWHINSDKPKEDFLIPTELVVKSDDGITLIKTVFPKAKDIKLDFSDTPLSVYEGDVVFGGIVKLPDSIAEGSYNLIIQLNYQACDNSTCLAPSEVYDTLQITVVNKSEVINEINQEDFKDLDLSYSAPAEVNSGEDDLQNQLEKSGLILSLLLVFLGGLALNLTPCVYPLIPITIGFFGSQSEGSTGRLALMGLMYLLGMAVTYSIIGVVTSLSGAVFGALLQNPVVIIFVALVMVALALSMFGLYEIKVPDALMQKASESKGGLLGALFMGLTMGIIAAPCIGPFVLGLVTYVAALGDPFRGFLLFFFLAVGLGTPYFVLAIFSGKIKALPRAGSWMESVKIIFGFVMLGMALYFLLPLFPESISGYLLPAFMFFSGIYLIFFEKHGNKLSGFRVFKYILSVIVIAVAVYLVIPTEYNSVQWKKYNNKDFKAALASNDKIIIDFYADWCIPCKELDRFTFTDDRVIEMTSEYKAFKADLTKSNSAEVEALRKEFKIVGVPTVLLIGTDGKEVERITGFLPPEEFVKKLEMVK